jgi:ElaB/YqjD/DUF883 family membrane-anchored ribosome-binding protein
MAKKTKDLVLSMLRKLLKGKVEGDDLEKVEEALEDIEFPDPGSALGEDEVAIPRTELRGLKDDLKGLRAKKNELQDQVQDLEDAQESGEKLSAKKAKNLQLELDTLRPTMDKLLKRERTRWDAAKDKLEDKVKGKFAIPEKPEDLTDDQLLENTARLDEYVELGLVDLAVVPAPEDKTLPPTTPRIGAGPAGKKPTAAELDAMTPRQKIEAGYTNLTIEEKRGLGTSG